MVVELEWAAGETSMSEVRGEGGMGGCEFSLCEGLC